MTYGTVEAYRTSGGGQAHFGASTAPVLGHLTYIAIVALILNVAVSAVLTVVFRKVGLQDGYDETRRADYTADPVTVPAASARPRTPAVPPTRPTAGADRVPGAPTATAPTHRAP